MSNKKNDSKIKKSIIPVPILVRKELLDKKKDSLIGDLQGLEQQIMQIQNDKARCKGRESSSIGFPAELRFLLL